MRTIYIKEKDHNSAVFEADFSDIFKYYNILLNYKINKKSLPI